MRLYNSNETNFIHNGLGLLSNAISSVATEELNGMFELHIEYDSEGFLADVIDEEMIIKAKANDKQDEQLFRIYSITKNHENDNLIIDAQHITYDLANNFVESLEARNLTKRQVMQLIGSSTQYTHRFNVTSSNNTTQSSTSLYRTNPLQMIAGMEGSILQIWGGQIERDNFNLIMHDRRGSDDGVLVTYKKNLTGLNAKFDISNLVTRIFPYVFIPATDDEPEQLITVPGKYIDSPYINNYEMPYILPVDFSYEEGIETSQDLLNAASGWFVETSRDNPRVEMEVQFEHLWETEEYKDVAALELVGMGDTITVKHSKLKVEGTAIVNRIEYDVIARKNIAVDVGHVKASFTDKVNQVDNIVERVDKVEQSANQAIRSANGKNTIYYGPDEPTDGNEDDIWFRVVDGEYTRTYRFDGIQWQLVVSADVKDIEEVANTARNNANEAVEKANLATSNALEAISEAQTAFDEAQAALNTASSASDLASTVHDLATALDTTVSGHTTTITNIENELSSKMTTIDADNKYATQSALQQTSQSLSSDIVAVQGNLDSLEIGGRNLAIAKDVVMVRANLSSAWEYGEVIDNRTYKINAVIPNGVHFLFGATKAEYMQDYIIHADMSETVSSVVGVVVYDKQNNIMEEDGLIEGDIVWVSTYRSYQRHSDNVINTPLRFKVIDNRVGFIRAKFGVYRGNSTTQDVYIKDPMLEKGNKATDWSPAPEDIEYQFSSINQTVSDITTRVGDSEGNITALQQTSTSFATRIGDAEGNISTLTQTAQGLQNRVSDAEGNISSVTQLATGMQTRLTNAEGSISTLTQTASSLDSTIKSVRDDLDGLEIGGRNYFVISEAIENRLISWANGTLGNETGSLASGFIPVDKNEQFILNHPAQQLFYYTSNKVHLEYGGNKIPGDSFTIPNLDSVKFIRIVFRNNFLNGRSKEEVRVKLEKGNKVTDWTPAPEDMATQSQITQLSNNINARVQKGDVINQINISTESILISGKKLILDGDTTVTGTFRVANANITSVDAGKMTTGTLDAANVNIINLNASNIVSGTINTANIMIRGGSATDYTMIDGSYLESRGKFTRTWRGTTRTHDIKLRLQDGYLRTRNDSLDRSLYYSDYGISTFVDGSGAEAGENSSGTIEFFSHEYDSAVRGLTLHSSGILGLRANKNIIMLDAYASVNIESEESAIYFRPITSRSGSNVFRMTLSEGSNPDGYLLYGSEADPQASGLRFSKRRSDPRLQVVDFNYQTGGNTTIEAGIGEFNDIKRRSGNSNIYIAHANLLTVGDDSTGGRLASIATYNRTYSSAANMHITSAGTFGRSTSARKYKRDIEPITKEYAYNFLDNVTPIFYRPHNTADENMSLSHYGYIADDVAPIEPRLVQFGQDGEPEGFSYDRTPTLLHVVLKNEVKRIDELEELAETQQLIIEGLQLKIAKLESVA